MKKQAKDLKPGDVVNPPQHERGWLWKDGVKRTMTVLGVCDGRPDARGPWLEVTAEYSSPYGPNVTSGRFSYRPTTMVTVKELVQI